MKLQRSHLVPLLVLAGAISASGVAVAQDSAPKSSMAAQEMKQDVPASSALGMPMGSHDMPATVTDVDHKTGMVDVDSMNMKLKLHFPASTVADLKKGDKITVHLGFTKQ